MIGYKAFDENLQCRGMQYEIGKTFEMKCKPIICEQGFHFCKDLTACYSYYPTNKKTRICKIEAIGDLDNENEKKYCTNKIVILEEIKDLRIKKCNTGYHNTGYFNTGYQNTGNHNSGSCNNGWYNTGYYNNGDGNSGNHNFGHCNSGCYNSGSGNSGNFNSGKFNSGQYNSGSFNSGSYNCGCYNSGIFNTLTYPKIKMFDKETDWTMLDWEKSDAKSILIKCPNNSSIFINSDKMTEEEKEKYPDFEEIGGYIKIIECTPLDKQEWWDNLSQKDKEKVFALPNFDEEKFIKCLGIIHI